MHFQQLERIVYIYTIHPPRTSISSFSFCLSEHPLASNFFMEFDLVEVLGKYAQYDIPYIYRFLRQQQCCYTCLPLALCADYVIYVCMLVAEFPYAKNAHVQYSIEPAQIISAKASRYHPPLIPQVDVFFSSP